MLISLFNLKINPMKNEFFYNTCSMIDSLNLLVLYHNIIILLQTIYFSILNLVYWPHFSSLDILHSILNYSVHGFYFIFFHKKIIYYVHPQSFFQLLTKLYMFYYFSYFMSSRFFILSILELYSTSNEVCCNPVECSLKPTNINTHLSPILITRFIISIIILHNYPFYFIDFVFNFKY